MSLDTRVEIGSRLKLNGLDCHQPCVGPLTNYNQYLAGFWSALRLGRQSRRHLSSTPTSKHPPGILPYLQS